MEPGRGRGPAASIRYRSYRRRWFLLFATCTLSCSNAMCWLTFAPVADQTARYFHISVNQVNWLSMIYLVVGVPFGFGTTWILDMLGLKTSLILSSWLNLAGCALQLLSVTFFIPHDSWKFPLLMVGQTFGALAQPLVLFSPTKLAAIWFPEQQRATANMISSMANPLGILFANILSPLLVKEPSSMPLLLGVYAVPAVIACLLTTVGIRNKAPPTPPSAGAANSTSEPFITGMKMVSRMRDQPYGLAVVCSLFGLLGFSIYPVCMELGVECSYPVGEATSAGLIFISGQLQGALLILLLPGLARPVTSDGSVCQVGVGAALDWTIPTLVLAAICSLEACCFAFLFHTEYRRVSAEDNEDAAALLAAATQ
ncbi:solute carrier family 49 member A3 isoform X3 [Heterodontus francisci]|uniref:solute carrier family 49 member A3 isoform X3 n=1 Tax=Heterodontus francisci TaxID=7792 RepID=UPI00355C2630